MMLNNIHEILFMVAQDFVKLTPLQQINVGIRIEVCGAEAGALPIEEIGETIFKSAYNQNKIQALVKEMRQYLYEQS